MLCRIRVVIVYLAGVVFGSVGGSLPSPTSYLAGASAGVYALIAAHVSTLVMNWKVIIIIFCSVRAQGMLVAIRSSCSSLFRAFNLLCSDSDFQVISAISA